MNVMHAVIAAKTNTLTHEDCALVCNLHFVFEREGREDNLISHVERDIILRHVKNKPCLWNYLQWK